MKRKWFISGMIGMLLLFSMACSVLHVGQSLVESPQEQEDAAVATVATIITPAVAAATPLPAQPTMIPTSTATVKPERTPAPSWRMAPPEGSFLMVQDTDQDPAWEELAAMHAAVLAIPAPYFYELYVLREGIKFPEVQKHYQEEMRARRYTMARNEQGESEVYLMTFLYSLNSSSKNAVLFYAQLSNRDPMVLVIYSQPVEE